MVAKRPRETKASRRVSKELRADHRELGEGIVYADADGTIIEPQAVRRLGPEARSQYRHLSQLSREREGIENEIRALVLGMRSHGISWSVIGLAIGTTGEAARKRYGLDR